jgi:hypothetical protein
MLPAYQPRTQAADGLTPYCFSITVSMPRSSLSCSEPSKIFQIRLPPGTQEKSPDPANLVSPWKAIRSFSKSPWEKVQTDT